MVNEIALTNDLPVIASDKLIEIAEKAEKRIEAVKKIKQTALKVTNEADWVDENGRPYLQVSGSEKIARLFDISWKIDGPQYDFSEDGHYICTWKGTFSIGNVSIEAIGSRSSRDGFFKRYGYEDGKKQELPPSTIEKNDVEKAAYTNLLGNGITRLLGIRNMSYDDLAAVGLDISKIRKVEYKRKGKPAVSMPQEINAIPENDKTDTVVTNIVKITKTTGNNKQTGSPYSLFRIYCDNNILYSTFDEKIANIAKSAQEASLPVSITFKPDKFNTISKMEIVEPTEMDSNAPISLDIEKIADETIKEIGHEQ
jgi:hypothetical protein